MQNIALIIVLGVAFAASAYFSTASITAKEASDRISQTKPETYDTDFNKKSTFLKKNDIEILSQNYPEPYKILTKTIIDVPIVNQYPELPKGCEIVSATALLNYLGYKVDKLYLKENFLEESWDFQYFSDKMRVGPDPNNVFVGDPESNGFGCYPPVIVKSLNGFFKSVGSKNYAIDVKDADVPTLEKLIDNGIPVIVWTSMNMKPFKYISDNEWVLDTTGEVFRWPGNSHTIVLVGYDDKNYYFSDCNDKSKIAFYKKDDFAERWVEFGNKAVIVKLED
ncbi:MAG: C39 family peptidase [Oscillospiraceae bacterium]